MRNNHAAGGRSPYVSRRSAAVEGARSGPPHLHVARGDRCRRDAVHICLVERAESGGILLGARHQLRLPGVAGCALLCDRNRLDPFGRRDRRRPVRRSDRFEYPLIQTRFRHPNPTIQVALPDSYAIWRAAHTRIIGRMQAAGKRQAAPGIAAIPSGKETGDPRNAGLTHRSAKALGQSRAPLTSMQRRPVPPVPPLSNVMIYSLQPGREAVSDRFMLRASFLAGATAGYRSASRDATHTPRRRSTHVDSMDGLAGTTARSEFGTQAQRVMQGGLSAGKLSSRKLGKGTFNRRTRRSNAQHAPGAGQYSARG